MAITKVTTMEGKNPFGKVNFIVNTYINSCIIINLIHRIYDCDHVEAWIRVGISMYQNSELRNDLKEKIGKYRIDINY